MAFVRLPVELGEIQIRIGGPVDQNVVASHDVVARGRTLLRSRWSRTRSVELTESISKCCVDQAVQTGKIAARQLEIGEIEHLVFLDRSTHAGAGLMPPLRRIERCIPV